MPVDPGTGQGRWSCAAVSRPAPGAHRCGDSFAAASSIDGEEVLLVVADGVGSLPSPWTASRTTCAAVLARWREDPERPAGRRLADAVEWANEEVHGLRDAAAGGKSTLVAAVFERSTRTVRTVNVGDSRLYLVRGGRPELKSTDDKRSVRFERGGRPVLVHGRVQSYQGLTRAVGQAARLGVEPGELRLDPGDSLVLVTDGCYEADGFLEAIEAVDRRADLRGAVGSLVIDHRAGRFQDDATVLVFRPGGEGREELASLRVELRDNGRALLPDRAPHLCLEAAVDLIVEDIGEGRLRDVVRWVESCAEHRLHPERADLERVLDAAEACGNPRDRDLLAAIRGFETLVR